MPHTNEDRREELVAIKFAEMTKGGDKIRQMKLNDFKDGTSQYIFDAMDEYMKECCLELLEYMAKNTVYSEIKVDDKNFYCNGEWLTKEQLFENFL